MQWIKRGLLFSNENKLDWSSNSALQPTPLTLNNNTVRIYCGMRDSNGVSRVGFVDVQKNGDTLSVINICDRPALNIGLPGTFDDNGVVPTAVVEREGKIYLYYAGYQLVKNVRFLVLCGLAISEDGGFTFSRYKNTPVLERTDNEFLFRVLHTIIYDAGRWRVWYGGGNHFQPHGDRTLPVYDIRYMESEDGIHFPETASIALPNLEVEHRVGRPFVIKKASKYFMFFGASTPSVTYRLAYAVSDNGHNWKRMNDLGIEYKQGEFDSDMSAYPAIVELEEVTYMIYNGNKYGKFGFGYAQLIGKL